MAYLFFSIRILAKTMICVPVRVGLHNPEEIVPSGIDSIGSHFRQLQPNGTPVAISIKTSVSRGIPSILPSVQLNEITDRSGIVERIAVGGVYFELEPIVRRIGSGFGRDVTSSAQQAVPTPCGIRSFDAEIRTVQRSGLVGSVSGSNQFGSRPKAVGVRSVQIPKIPVVLR